jgi:hypothetical protein
VSRLAPVIVNRHDIAGHGLWLVCSLLALVLFAVMFAVNGRAPETRAGVLPPLCHATGEGDGGGAGLAGGLAALVWIRP